MAGTTRLFEKLNGLLVEIDPSQADARRAGKRISHVNLSIDILFTDEEEASANAEEAANAAAQQQAAADLQVKQAAAALKLDKLGLTVDDLKALGL